jgi:hypothetical protein
VSVIDLFEDFRADGFPLFISSFSLVWCLRREPDDPVVVAGSITIKLDDEQLVQFPVTANFERTQINRQILSVGGLVVPRPGKLRAVFHADDVSEVTYEFGISARMQLAPPPANPPSGV